MAFERFSIRLAARIGFLALTLLGLVTVMLADGDNYPVLIALLTLATLLQLISTVRYVQKTNTELGRFLDAVKYADFGQRFDMRAEGAGFDSLGLVFTDIMQRIQDARQHQEQEYRYMRTLIEHVPIPSLSIQSDGNIVLHNNAARRLFGNSKVLHADDLTQFGQAFADKLISLQAGERDLATFRLDTIEKQLTVAAAQVTVGNRTEKLISLQDIQPELDDAQLQAWQGLVRVLTHEIMNSITPISSLANTTKDLVDDARRLSGDLPETATSTALNNELDDVMQAVDTIAHRSESLTQFVQSYRRLTRLPEPNKQSQSVAEVLRACADLVADECQQQGIEISTELSHEALKLEADREMLEQVLINLLRNSIDALSTGDAATQKHIQMRAYLNPRGHVVIEVIDNGPGIATELADKIFVPFFTSKREGSGVGLALTRQIMVAHGGSVSIGDMESLGARIVLTF